MYEVSLMILLLLWFSGVSCQASHKCYIQWDSLCVPIFVNDSHQLPYELVSSVWYIIKKKRKFPTKYNNIYHYKE